MQKKIFRRQLALAVSLEKPIIIHSRKAEKETIAALKETVPKDHKIHLHMFNESEDYAKVLLIDFPNLYFGLTGAITFASASSTQKVVEKTIPSDRSTTLNLF
jgi:TatD DNase family protein